MAYYHPCKNCAVSKDKCVRRNEIKSAIAGLSVTSVKFKCDDRTSRFRSGQRVEFKWTHYANEQISECYVDAIETNLSFVGTVVNETKSRLRFTVRVDVDQKSEGMAPSEVFRNDSLVINVKPDDMRPINESDRRLCQSCLAYDEGEASARCHGFRNHFDTYHPQGCLLPIDELK